MLSLVSLGDFPDIFNNTKWLPHLTGRFGRYTSKTFHDARKNNEECWDGIFQYII